MSRAECIEVRIAPPNIMVVNNCDSRVFVDKIDVKYYVTGLTRIPSRSNEEVKRFKRRIMEQLSIGKSLEPSESLRIYFGPVESIEEIYLHVRMGGEARKIKPPITIAEEPR
ncbi:MAG: hypothetical protein ABWW69_06670 [Pyrodictiaceae archaeon]